MIKSGGAGPPPPDLHIATPLVAMAGSIISQEVLPEWVEGGQGWWEAMEWIFLMLPQLRAGRVAEERPSLPCLPCLLWSLGTGDRPVTEALNL
jgi:hypothetical protein